MSSKNHSCFGESTSSKSDLVGEKLVMKIIRNIKLERKYKQINNFELNCPKKVLQREKKKRLFQLFPL